MDFFGIGAMELLLILVLALLVVGPRRLPEAARKLAKILREMRRMWTDVSTDFAKELSIEGASEDFRTIAETVGTLRHAGSPAKLLQDIVPKDVVTTLENRPPSPAQLLAGAAPGARTQVPPAAATQAATGQTSPVSPASEAAQPPPPAATEGQVSSGDEAGAASEPAAPVEPAADVSSAASAEATAPSAMPEGESSHGA
jgi:sec-independent protein translocase protein TatB